MLGLIGLIIANQSSLQRKITMQGDIYVDPPLFSLAPQCRPQFFHSRIAIGYRCSQVPAGAFFHNCPLLHVFVLSIAAS